MSRVKIPFFSFFSRGSIARALTARPGGTRASIEKYPFPKDANTSNQQPQRALFRDAVAFWHTLTPAEKLAYDSPGAEHHMSGYSWFISRYLNNPPAATFLALTDTPASYSGQQYSYPQVNSGETDLEFKPDWTRSKSGAYLPGFQEIAPVSIIIIQNSTETFDGLNEYNPATYRFTASEDGYYQITAGLRWLVCVANTVYNIQIFKNGANIAFQTLHATSTAYLCMQTTKILFLSAGDYIDARAQHNHGSSQWLANGDSQTWIRLHRLS